MKPGAIAPDSLRVFGRAWRWLLRLWRPMAAWSFVTWGLATLFVTPLSSLVLGRSVLRGNRPVVGNEELLAWGLSLPGITWILLAGAFAMTATVFQFAGFFHIVGAARAGRPVRIAETVVSLLPELPRLFRLCVAAVATGILLTIPVAAGLVLIRWLLIGAYDINYYLAERPIEWTAAVAVAIGWLLVAGAPALYLVARSALALPAYLDGHLSLRRALRESWSRTRRGAGRLASTLTLLAGAWIAVRAAAASAWVGGGTLAVGWIAAASASLKPVVAATAVYLTGLVFVDAVIAFAGFSLASILLTMTYHADTGPHRSASAAETIVAPARRVRRVRAAFRPRVIVPVAVILCAASVVSAGALLQGVNDPRPATVIAHRAGPLPAPENTLAALERAVAVGAALAEIDVQRTRDGVVVVFHDADLMRLAGDSRKIRASTYVELAGVAQRPAGAIPAAERRVATLAEFLERARERIGLLIELKYYGADPGLAAAVLRDVRAAGMDSEVRIMSLDYGAVRDVARRAHDIETGYVAAAVVGQLARLPVDFIAVAQSRISPQLIRAAQRNQLAVYAWTVNRPDQMADLIEMGVDGIITDKPALAVRVNAELAELSPVARLLLRFRDLWDEEDVHEEQDPLLPAPTE